MTEMTEPQRKWCQQYENQTGFEPMMEDFKAGDETFQKAASKSVTWFEDWANDALRIISCIPDDEAHTDD